MGLSLAELKEGANQHLNTTKDKRAVITTIEFIALKRIKSNETTAYKQTIVVSGCTHMHV